MSFLRSWPTVLHSGRTCPHPPAVRWGPGDWTGGETYSCVVRAGLPRLAVCHVLWPVARSPFAATGTSHGMAQHQVPPVQGWVLWERPMLGE